MKNRREVLAAAGALGLTSVAGCIGDFGEQPYGDGEVSLLMSPTEPQDQMTAQYTPVQKQLNDYIDEVDEVSIQYAADYSATLNAMSSGTDDVAETGPFAAALGVNTDKAEIALQRKAYGSWSYKSVIVTNEDSDIEELADLEGKTVAFADALSASGSLYPLYMLKQAGLSIPDEPGNAEGANFTPQWSSHASAKEALVNGQADAAGVGYFIVAGDGQDGYAEGIREVAATDEIPRAPIVISPELADEEKTAITNAFLEAPNEMYYGEDGEEGTEDDIWFSDVRKADVDTYQPVVDLANELGYGEEVFADDS